MASCAAAAAAFIAASETIGSTLDRDYRFGDAGTSDPQFGATVIDGGPVGFFVASQGVNKTGDDFFSDNDNFSDAQDLVVSGEGLLHRLGVLLPQARARLEIGEPERVASVVDRLSPT